MGFKILQEFVDLGINDAKEILIEGIVNNFNLYDSETKQELLRMGVLAHLEVDKREEYFQNILVQQDMSLITTLFRNYHFPHLISNKVLRLLLVNIENCFLDNSYLTAILKKSEIRFILGELITRIFKNWIRSKCESKLLILFYK